MRSEKTELPDAVHFRSRKASHGHHVKQCNTRQLLTHRLAVDSVLHSQGLAKGAVESTHFSAERLAMS